MPVLEVGNVRHYYESYGDPSSPTIIANHGYWECTRYWTVGGVAQQLAERHHVVLYDLRGHGRTVVDGAPSGFDADTMADDIDAIADGLGVDTFHLLSHATGGMVAARYAMSRSARLRSLIITDAGSSTLPGRRDVARDTSFAPTDAPPEHDGTPDVEGWRHGFEQLRARPGAFLWPIDLHPDAERIWSLVREVLTTSNRAVTRAFFSAFYSDPDLRLDALRRVSCPTLVLLGEHDKVFLEEARLVAAAIPGAEHVVMPGIGHMTAIEAPAKLTGHLLDFLDRAEARLR